MRCCCPPESWRPALGEFAHVDEIKHLGDARRDLRLGPFVRLEAVGDVLCHRHVREQRIVLEHNADAAFARREVVDGLTVEQHMPLALADEARHDAQQRGLAAAGGAKQRHHLAAGYIQINVFHGNEIAEPLRDVGKLEPVPPIRCHAAAFPKRAPRDPGDAGSPGPVRRVNRRRHPIDTLSDRPTLGAFRGAPAESRLRSRCSVASTL